MHFMKKGNKISEKSDYFMTEKQKNLNLESDLWLKSHWP